MKKVILFLMFSVFFTLQAEAARGRQPCSGSKGGIARCTSDGRFVCNDGSLSQSKRFCSGYGTAGTRQQVKSMTPTRKTAPKKAISTKKQTQQQVAESSTSSDTQPRQPTCAPLYMANKPGYTHLPICSENEY